MNKKVLTAAVVLILLLTACAPQATPTVNPMDVQHTAEAAAFTMVAQTQESLPTNTTIPSTATESPTSLPTLTSIASPTAIGESAAVDTPTGIATLAALPTATTVSAAPTDDCNKTLTSWEVPTVNFSITNETRPQGTVVLSLWVMTEFGECGYLADTSRGPVGSYSAGAFVDGQQDFRVFGGFVISQGNWDIIIRNDRIIAQGSCYPNC